MRSPPSNNSTNVHLKINLLVGAQLLFALIFIIRLFSIQVLQHDKYRAMAEEQYWNLQEIPARRGDILSSDGFSLATTQIAYLLYAQPHKISDPLQAATDVAAQLVNLRPELYESAEEKSEVFDTYKDRFYEVLSLDLKWVVLEHYLSEEEKAAIQQLGTEGLGFEDEPKRYYPEGTLASHVLGFVAQNERGEEQGYFGIEGLFDGDLRGKPGRIIEERDATGAPILVGDYTRVNPINGRNIKLTVNRAIQYIVERELTEGVKAYGAASGSVVVMDPFTGDVIAMANFPTYHPSRFDTDTADAASTEEPGEDFGEEVTSDTSGATYTAERRNLAVSETYEPGSVLKTLTISAGIDSNTVTPETTFEDRGPVQYSDYTIDNWDSKHHGAQTIVELLQKSNNIGSAWVAHQVGRKTMHNYFTDFGLGMRTGIDLEGEDTGVLHDYQDWSDIDLATIAFGQGISATPLQILNAFNATANGGTLLKPRIVSEVTEAPEVISIPVKEVRRVISEKSAETMVDLLTQAVSGGESRYYNLANYEIAGKTGTAQIPVDGEYDPQKTNATFVGFLPNSKKFTMIVRLDRPSSSVYAAETAVPLWMNIADELIKYYGIPPDTR